MAHPCGDPNRATRCRAQSVAPNSRRIGDVAPKSRYTPPNQGFAPFSGPPCRTFLSFPAERGRGGLVEGIAALLGSENGSRYRGVSQLQSHQSRYSVQLSREVFTNPLLTAMFPVLLTLEFTGFVIHGFTILSFPTEALCCHTCCRSKP